MAKIKPLESETSREQFLMAKGWKKISVSHAWQWVLPKFPGARHTLEHAYDIARSTKG